MRSTLARLAFALPLFALCPSAASAQDGPLLDEDFLDGAADWFLDTEVQFWHVTAPGECGAPGGWATSSFTQAPCTYGTPPWAFVSTLTSPDFVPAGGPLLLTFDSRLELEPGDSVSVRLMPPSISNLPPLVIATEADLTNDGAIEAIEVLAPGADLYGGHVCHLRFDVLHDGSGDVGFGWMIDRIVLTDEPVARPFCVGEESGTSCPCGNGGGPGEGCAHTPNRGVRLEGVGSARIAADDLQIRALGGPAGQPGVLLRGSRVAPAPFRDGVLCIGAPSDRIARLTFSGAGAAAVGGPLASVASAAPGDRHHYQLWYRTPAGLCGAGSNLSSGVVIDWL